LQARLAGGEILLRMDDLDQARVRPSAADQIVSDLAWLGLEFDGPVIVQSNRGQQYLAAFNRLVAQGMVFPCRCSRRDIEQALSAPDGTHPASSYPGTCRPDQHPVPARYDGALAWRFLASDVAVAYTDQVLGTQNANLRQHPGDFVVRRKDGIIAYQLASVVDDGLLGVTDVVRGDDLADSTARQLALFDALGFARPRFWHVPLMTDRTGNKLAKRDGSDSLRTLRQHRYRAEEVIAELACSAGLIDHRAALSAAELVTEIGTNERLLARLQRATDSTRMARG